MLYTCMLALLWHPFVSSPVNSIHCHHQDDFCIKIGSDERTLYPTLHCHHQNDCCIKMGSDERKLYPMLHCHHQNDCCIEMGSDEGKLHHTLHCHHQKDFCIEMGSDDTNFTVSLIARGKSPDGVHKHTRAKIGLVAHRGKTPIPQTTSLYWDCSRQTNRMFGGGTRRGA